MGSLDARKLYRDAWDRLSGVVRVRNSLLRQLNSMLTPAISITMATSMIVTFDTAHARDLLQAIDELDPRIAAGIAEVNQYAEAAGSPKVRTQAVLPTN